MCVPRYEDVDVQLSLEQRQTGHVTPRDHLVAMDETDLKLAHCHHLLLRVVQVLIKVSSDYVNVSSKGLQVVIALLGAKVSCTEDVLYLPRDQQLLELGWQSVAPMGDVQVT